MTFIAQIENIQNYPDTRSDQFRDQLSRGREAGARMIFTGSRDAQGIDRSFDLAPIARPAVVRSLTEELK